MGWCHLKITSRARKTKDPCPICRLHKALCICAQIPKLNLVTKVTLVIHAKELKRTSNTGTLALHALSNGEMKVRGEGREALDLSSLLDKQYHTVLLYPADDGLELTPEYCASIAKPIQLLVPDGNWRQASKVHYRHPELSHIPRVKLSVRAPENDFLRVESVPNGMATLQAIAHALRVIEGETVGDALLALYHLKLKKTLEGRRGQAQFSGESTR